MKARNLETIRKNRKNIHWHFSEGTRGIGVKYIAYGILKAKCRLSWSTEFPIISNIAY